MRYLIDTHVFIFWGFGSLKKLRDTATEILRSPDYEVCVSAVSVSEIALKIKLGKLDLPADFSRYIKLADYKELPLTTSQAQLAGSLELVHRDPFDRMLAAQGGRVLRGSRAGLARVLRVRS